jgi:predicted dehydrogenase
MEGGIRYAYTGSWCSPGAETSWNGVWRVSGEKGSARWDGDHEPVLDADGPGIEVPRSPYDGIEGALLVFTDALRTGDPPMGEVHENVLSLAMVEAAVRSADTGERVQLDDVLAAAHAEALRTETHSDVRDALASWPSVREVLTAAG